MISLVGFEFPEPTAAKATLKALTPEPSRLLFILNDLVERRQKLPGPRYHELVGELLSLGELSEGAVFDCFRRKFPGCRVSPGELREAAARAERLVEGGHWVVSWQGEGGQGEGTSGCPQVLFGLGRLASPRAWAAVFNSRKPRNFSPEEPWLKAMRRSLAAVAQAGLGLAASWGTVSYDLAAVYGDRNNIPMLLVLLEPLHSSHGSGRPPSARMGSDSCALLSCRTQAVNCPRGVAMVCRDRLLAWLADIHLLVAVREEGNLAKVLQTQQKLAPRRQVSVRREEDFSSEFKGPGKGRGGGQSQAMPGTDPSPLPTPVKPHPRPPAIRLKPETLSWASYLYHYTRSRPGPWPGQGYRDYLLALLDGEPSSGHTVLDTLVRILAEGRIRADGRFIRGGHPVVSWTARGPLELAALRRWNRALIRWTFEPCGVAVKRGVLKKKGAMPVVYAPDRHWVKLAARDRFRFQRHHPPECNWKYEREWRLPGDLLLQSMTGCEAFVFVNTFEQLDGLVERVALKLPVLILSDCV